jgi:hypothetical protein
MKGCQKFITEARDGNAGPLRLRSGQAFDSAVERFAQDDRLCWGFGYAAFVERTLDSSR